MHYLYKSTATLLLILPISVVSLAAEPQNTAESMQGMSHHQGTDSARHPQTRIVAVVDKSQGMDMDTAKHQGMGMMGGMDEKHLRAMQEHMLMMHDYSNQILAEKDPAKQAQLKNQQLELMKAHHVQMMQHGQQMK